MSFYRRPQSQFLRKAIFQIHLWAGVAVALYVMLIGITGAALVFRPQMQKRTFPQFFNIPRNGEPDAAPAVIIGELQQQFPGYKLSGIDFPTYRRDTYLSYLTKGNELRSVFSHPVTGRVIGELPKTSWITQFQDLHFNLLAGPTGRTVNGVIAFILVLMFATGIIVWWPGIDRWRRSLMVNFSNGWKRINWDLHSAIGFWLFALLMLWAVTGVEFAFPRGFRSMVNCVSPLSSFRAPQSKPIPGGVQPSADPALLVARGKEMVPGAIMGRLVLPSNPKGATLVLLARDVHGDFQTNDEVHLYFDQYTGALIQRRDLGTEVQTAGDLTMKWMGPLHVGSFGGLGVQSLWAFLALSFPALAITGVLMWWNRVVRKQI